MSKSVSKTHVGNVVVASLHQKQAESARIAADIAAFEARGGVIQVMKFGERDKPHLTKREARGAAKQKKTVHDPIFSKNKIDKPLETISLEEADEEAANE